MKSLRFLYLLFLLPLVLRGADAANDLLLTQRNSGNTGNTQRNLTATANTLLGWNGTTITNITAGTGISIAAGVITATGGGTGTVTSVSVATANGVSGTVATATTTPAITLILGAIVPTSVNGNTISIGTGTLTLGSATLNAGAGGTLGSNAFTSTAYAPLASPSLTGVPTAPTATLGTNTTQLATTAFVLANAVGSANAVTAASTASGAGRFWLTNGADRSAVDSDTVTTANITTANVITLNSSALTSTSSSGLTLTASHVTGSGLHLAVTARTSGANSYLGLTIPADTGITASTESVGFNWVTGTRTWATTGTVALQREIFFAGPTYASASASQTFTDAFNLYLTPPVAGTNAIFTRGHTLGIVDSTDAASSITGGFVISNVIGTATTSIGMGNGNIRAGGNMYSAGLFVTGGSAVTLSPTGGNVTISPVGNLVDISPTGASGGISLSPGGTLTIAPAVTTSGSGARITITPPSDTGRTASTESIFLNLATGTRTWATTGTVALERHFNIAGPTLASASASQTFTDAFTLYLTPPVAGTNAIITRDHTLGIVDSTSAASSITGAVVISTTIGTTATSVGIGGGNINAGGTGTFGGLVTSGGSTLAKISDTYATHLGTFASPDTTAGAITWTSPVYNIYTSAGSTRTYTLPAAASFSGQAIIMNVAVGTGHVNLQPASGASLVLAGVLLTANHYIQDATSAPGDYICAISDGTNWTTLGSAGTWTDAASP